MAWIHSNCSVVVGVVACNVLKYNISPGWPQRKFSSCFLCWLLENMLNVEIIWCVFGTIGWKVGATLERCICIKCVEKMRIAGFQIASRCIVDNPQFWVCSFCWCCASRTCCLSGMWPVFQRWTFTKNWKTNLHKHQELMLCEPSVAKIFWQPWLATRARWRWDKTYNVSAFGHISGLLPIQNKW